MNINIRLDKSFTTAFNKMLQDGGEELAKLNGFAEEQLSYTDFIDHFIDKNVADASIDGNSNVRTKDICTLLNEMSKPHLKLLTFNKIFYEFNKKYGYRDACDWLEAEWNGKFYLHDGNSSSQISYCYAYDLERLVTEGMFFIPDFNAQPPQHLTTYTDFVGEFVSWTSNRTSGACGLPSFLIYSYYFWRKDCEEGFYQKTPEYYRDQEFQRIVYKLNQPYLRVNQSAFTNFSIFDRPYLEELFGGKEFPDGSFIIDHIDDILEYQKDFMKVVDKIRTNNMMTFPVLTYALLKKEGKFVDEEYAKWCCRHNMKWADSNFFVSEDITSLSSCCRLVSDISVLGYFENKENSLGYQNSIGGTALEVGSVKVNTINLARISYEANKDEYLELLEERVILNLKTLDIVRNIIRRNVEKGLLPNYSLKIINMDSQYNTIGIIGIYETLQKYDMVKTDEFGYTSYTDEGLKFAQDILGKINEVKNEFAKDVDYNINVEQVPAERAAYILMQKDMMFFPNEKYELPLYGNQWIPLAVKTSVAEKVKISALLDKACNGGSISHINIDAPFSNFEQAWKMLNYVSDAGVPYFAFCLKISSCENNHGFYGETCPECGGEKTTTYQRVVGFLVSESSYSFERKAEFEKRDWMNLFHLPDY